MASLPLYGKPRITSGADGSCGCCGEWYGKEQAKHREERQWRRDWADESKPSCETDPEPDMDDEGGEAFPENLSQVRGVTFIPASN
jgi:hypothetical protein